MPSAPLYYQPLVRAKIETTPLGDSTLYDARQNQFNFSFSKAPGSDQYMINPETPMATKLAQSDFAPVLAQYLTGVENLQKAMPGSKALEGIQIARDDSGWIANRVETFLRNHPEALDTASPDQAGEIAKNLIQQAGKELEARPGMMLSGATMEVAPDIAAVLEKHWIGESPLSTEEATALGVKTMRELQHAVTPTPPDAQTPLQWIENASAELLATWPGSVSKTVEALGVKADAAAVDKLAGEWRKEITTSAPHAEGARSVSALLGVAGISPDDAAARDAAFQALQANPLEGVPLGIAQAIVGNAKLPEEASGYLAGRIAETGGTDGNIKGLLAEIEAMRQSVPAPAPAPAPGPPEPAPPEPEPEPAPPAPEPEPAPPAPELQ